MGVKTSKDIQDEYRRQEGYLPTSGMSVPVGGTTANAGGVPIVADPNNKSAGTGLHIVGNTVNTGTSSHLNGNVMNNAAHSDGVYNNKDTVDDEGVVVTSPVSAPSVDMPTSSVGGTSSASGSSVPAPSGGNKTSSSPTIEEFYDDEGEDLENQTSGEDLENQPNSETDGETGDGEDDEAFADLDRVIDELLNFKYKDFSYDPLSDPTYLQYQKQYQRNAQAAMENAAALAATRTGGYGNSYASVASQQAYDAQMDELNDILPQLYEQAYSRHQTEESQRLQQLLNEYTVLSGEREYADGRTDVEWKKDITEDQIKHDREQEESDKRLSDAYTYALNHCLTYYGADDFADYDPLVDEPIFKKEFGLTDSEWETLRLQIDQYMKSVRAAYAESDEDGQALQHVASMSTQELVDALAWYKDTADDDGLASFLEDCKNIGRLTEDMAEAYWEKYATDP